MCTFVHVEEKWHLHTFIIFNKELTRTKLKKYHSGKGKSMWSLLFCFVCFETDQKD